VTEQIRQQLQATLGAAYTLERELGGGGMSRVFLAEETALRRKVVVKVLPSELAAGVNVERFNREIQTAAALQQANIVPLLSAGDTGGLPFYTMPFVEGESLRARLARGPMTVTEVIGILRDVARALAYAHQRGVVHRDIKPDNVLISGGTAVVTDFGIAKAISASRTAQGGATLTQIGTSIGTPAYMAPEQAAGDPDVDHRADIYSLGCMAFELLSGQAVFAGRTPQRMLAAHMGEAPRRISELRGDLPQTLADLVDACLAKEPGQRPQQAGDIVRTLETITSGSGMPVMPPVLLGGPEMFRKALTIYAVAFVAVAILAKAAIVGIGLPDWVFPGALIVMALGLPLVLWTGYVQRVTRHAITMTPTFTPGGTPSLTHGTMATMALKAAPHVSWYKTARGVTYAVGAFIVVIAAFMGMRAFGIGPFGSLIATGAFRERDRVIITDFAVSSGDAALGRVVADAIRAGLGDSRVITLETPAEIAAALQRMQQPGTAHLDLALARQVALREGVKAIVDGDVTLVGSSYIVAVRLVTADSGRELASYRGTASSSNAIINVADDLSRKLRAKAGESLRKVHGTPALAYASTSSLEALRKYSEGSRANDAERDYPKAVRLLREAVAIDSNFGEGWRKLSAAIGNTDGYAPSAADSAITRAYRLRDRMTERERDVVIGFYFSHSPGFDRAKAIATYERMLARGDSGAATINLGLQYITRREYAKAEQLFRANIAAKPGDQLAWLNLLFTLGEEGKLRERDSLLAVARARFPAASGVHEQAIEGLMLAGLAADARKALDSARKAGDPSAPSWATERLARLAAGDGRFREQRQLRQQTHVIDSTTGSAVPLVFRTGSNLYNAIEAGLPLAMDLKAFDDALPQAKFESRPIVDRPYLYLADINARAGRVDRAKAWLARYDAVVRDTAYRRYVTPEMQMAQAQVAMAEHRWKDAAVLIRQSDQAPDGPSGACDYCTPLELIKLFAAAGMADSALAAYDEYRRSPMGSRPRQGPDDRLGAPLTEALAKMYDAKGDAANAARLYGEFAEAWKNADAELQPRVAAARERMKKLAVVERGR
jgi:hypothetical protein